MNHSKLVLTIVVLATFSIHAQESDKKSFKEISPNFPKWLHIDAMPTRSLPLETVGTSGVVVCFKNRSKLRQEIIAPTLCTNPRHGNEFLTQRCIGKRSWSTELSIFLEPYETSCSFMRVPKIASTTTVFFSAILARRHRAGSYRWSKHLDHKPKIVQALNFGKQQILNQAFSSIILKDNLERCEEMHKRPLLSVDKLVRSPSCDINIDNIPDLRQVEAEWHSENMKSEKREIGCLDVQTNRHGLWLWSSGESYLLRNYNHGEYDGQWLMKNAHKSTFTCGQYSNGIKTGFWVTLSRGMITLESYSSYGNLIESEARSRP